MFYGTSGSHYSAPDSRIPIERSSVVPIQVNPHYTDDRFRESRTTYLGPLPSDLSLRDQDPDRGIAGLTYSYNDRLQQWDYDKFKASVEAADRCGAPKNSAKWFSALMTHYNGKPTTVYHVMAGVNVSNGYPYYVLGHRET